MEVPLARLDTESCRPLLTTCCLLDTESCRPLLTTCCLLGRVMQASRRAHTCVWSKVPSCPVGRLPPPPRPTHPLPGGTRASRLEEHGLLFLRASAHACGAAAALRAYPTAAYGLSPARPDTAYPTAASRVRMPGCSLMEEHGVRLFDRLRRQKDAGGCGARRKSWASAIMGLRPR
jgi:hypothetical protein